jgi:hypothetical protein
MKSKLFLLMLLQTAVLAANVTTMRVPDGGIQPQVAIGTDGAVHMIFYKGDEKAGDIFYVRCGEKEKDFSKAIRVNSQKGSAIAMGTIRGAQLALGKNNRVHIVWNGGSGALKAKLGSEEITPLLYARMNDSQTAFEPERNLITRAAGLDGGSSIAADHFGNVYAFWHARIPETKAEGEDGRAVFVARSTDEGKTFSAETQAVQEPTGACGCCGMRAFADAQGAVYILYRAATQKMNRDEVLAISEKPGAPFKIANKHPWKLQTCPMSSAFISGAGESVLASWETAGQVYFSEIAARGHSVGEIKSPAGSGKRKHPVAISNAAGEILLVWTEDTAWAKGGSVAWQRFDSKLKPISEVERVGGLPVWSMAAALTKPSGDFVIIY